MLADEHIHGLHAHVAQQVCQLRYSRPGCKSSESAMLPFVTQTDCEIADNGDEADSESSKSSSRGSSAQVVGEQGVGVKGLHALCDGPCESGGESSDTREIEDLKHGELDGKGVPGNILESVEGLKTSVSDGGENCSDAYDFACTDPTLTPLHGAERVHGVTGVIGIGSGAYRACIAFLNTEIRTQTSRSLADVVGWHVTLMTLKASVVGELSSVVSAPFEEVVRRAIHLALASPSGPPMRMHFTVRVWLGKHEEHICSPDMEQILAHRRRLLDARTAGLDSLKAAGICARSELREARLTRQRIQQQAMREAQAERLAARRAERAAQRAAQRQQQLEEIQAERASKRAERRKKLEDRLANRADRAAQRLRRQRLPQLLQALRVESRVRARGARARAAAKAAANARAKRAAKAEAKAAAKRNERQTKQLRRLLRQQGYAALPDGVWHDPESQSFYAGIATQDGSQHTAPLHMHIVDAETDLQTLLVAAKQGDEALQTALVDIEIGHYAQIHGAPWL